MSLEFGSELPLMEGETPHNVNVEPKPDLGSKKKSNRTNNSESDNIDNNDNNLTIDNNNKQRKPAESNDSDADENKESFDNQEKTKDNQDNQDTPKHLEELNKTKEALNKANSWGHNKNRQLVKGLKNLKEVTAKLVENSSIYEEEANEILNAFDIKNIEQDDEPPSSESSNKKSLNTLDQNLQSELNNFKKYSSQDSKTLDAAYDSFFSNLSMYLPDQRAEIIDYIKTADPVDALKFIIDEGTTINERFMAPIKKHGNIFNYVIALENKLSKYEDDLNEIKNKDTQEDYVLPKNKNKGAYDDFGRF